MTFDQLPLKSAIFLDANTFVYAILNHPTYGGSCVTLLDRIERQEIQGFTSAHVLSDTVHRIMTLEACDRFGWPAQGMANRLRRHPAEVQQLLTPRRAVDEIQVDQGKPQGVEAVGRRKRPRGEGTKLHDNNDRFYCYLTRDCQSKRTPTTIRPEWT